MNLGIIAHNSKKVLIEDFCIAYKNILAKHEVYATGTTGRRIEEATGLHVHKFLPGSIGGDKQFMEMVERQDLEKGGRGDCPGACRGSAAAGFPENQ